MLVITGATGLVGTEVVRQARAEGYPVRAVVRDPARARWLAEQYGAELFHGNVIYGPALEGALAGANCVVHLVGIVREWRENTFERVHTQATINVVDAARRAHVKRFIHVSALGTRADAPSRYHQTKWAAEEYVRKSGLAWTIFRPSVIYGPGDKSIGTLAKVLRLAPAVPVLGNGRARIQPVAVGVVAQAIVRATRDDSSVQKTYDLCGPEAFTWNHLYEELMTRLGVQKAMVHLPLPLARGLAAIFEKLLPNPPFTRDALLMAAEDNVGDPKPAETEFALTQESFHLGMARYLSSCGPG